MTNWTTMADFSMTLPDRPGVLARLASQLREADVNLIGLWGYGSQDGLATLYCVPESAEQFQNFAKSAELAVKQGTTFFLSAADPGGTLVETLEKIAQAGINLLAIQAIAIHGKFGCFLWAEEPDWPKLKSLLNG